VGITVLHTLGGYPGGYITVYSPLGGYPGGYIPPFPLPGGYPGGIYLPVHLPVHPGGIYPICLPEGVVGCTSLYVPP